MNKYFRWKQSLQEEDIYHLSKLSVCGIFNLGGITANFDMYLVPDAIAGSVKDWRVSYGDCRSVKK